jgi:hypothetical protein
MIGGNFYIVKRFYKIFLRSGALIRVKFKHFWGRTFALAAGVVDWARGETKRAVHPMAGHRYILIRYW